MFSEIFRVLPPSFFHEHAPLSFPVRTKAAKSGEVVSIRQKAHSQGVRKFVSALSMDLSYHLNYLWGPR